MIYAIVNIVKPTPFRKKISITFNINFICVYILYVQLIIFVSFYLYDILAYLITFKNKITLNHIRVCYYLHRFLSKLKLYVPVCRPLQSILVWDVPVSSWGRMNLKLHPTQVLRECHADWINDCAWSNMSDFIVSQPFCRLISHSLVKYSVIVL